MSDTSPIPSPESTGVTDSGKAGAPHASSTSPSWSTRAEEAGDRAEVRRVNAAAFETEEEADLVDALRADPAWRPGLSLVAIDDEDRLIGHVLLTRCSVDGASALALAPVAVAPEQQGRGVGASLIRAALTAAREQGEQTVIVLGHPAYYPRFGFVPASRFGIRPPQDWPDEAFLALPLTEATPPVGTVRYPAPFGIE